MKNSANFQGKSLKIGLIKVTAFYVRSNGTTIRFGNFHPLWTLGNCDESNGTNDLGATKKYFVEEL